MENKSLDNVESTPEVQNPSRRRLLKALAAGGAVTAITMLPGKWSSPSVKTGVLPAHAQVTPPPTETPVPPTATPVPDEYEVRCSLDWEWFEGQEGQILSFSATAWNITANLTVTGVDLVATLTIGQLSPPPQTVATNAQGVATFSFEVPYELDPTSAMATVKFDDQEFYGADFCTTTYPEQEPV